MVRIMARAGVRFATLGPGERCCGDPARRTGNEFHYFLLAQANIALLDRLRVRRIVTHCPHCLQTLRHDYRQLGGAYEVLHHSQFVLRLLEEGRLRLSRPLDVAATFHDPCYLGRYGGIYDAPRRVLGELGAGLREMAHSRRQSLCCGAGGGHAFFEDRTGGRVNRIRAREALATDAEVVCTACPFCLGMLEAGVRSLRPEGGPQVRDLAELVADALEEVEDGAREREPG
jgi:Fe-S oxidoreductase